MLSVSINLSCVCRDLSILLHAVTFPIKLDSLNIDETVDEPYLDTMVFSDYSLVSYTNKPVSSHQYGVFCIRKYLDYSLHDVTVQHG